MIRVGFTVGFSDRGWLGGLYYFRNLFSAILALPQRRIDPVLLIGDSEPHDILKNFPPVTIIRNRAFGARSRWARLQWVSHHCLKRDVVIDAILRWHRIAVMSHSYRLGYGSTVPSIAWIADFQHVHLPEFFSPQEIEARNRTNAATAAEADRVLLSSGDAYKDFCRLYPQWSDKARIVSFVADMPDLGSVPDRAELVRRYGIEDSYFLVANQFWAHKNHRLIIDALQLLKAKGEAITVLATGEPHDHRWPGFYDDLMRHAAAQGVLDRFRVLGIVPRPDLVGLMKHAAAMVNPSRFEGWSTSVEEAKALGVRVIASDIAVHREQAAPGALYVHPDKPEELARALAAVAASPAPAPDRAAAASLMQRRNGFARAYEEVVLELCSGTKHRIMQRDANSPAKA